MATAAQAVRPRRKLITRERILASIFILAGLFILFVFARGLEPGEETRFILNPGRATVAGCCRYAVEPLRGAVPEEWMHVVYNGVRGPSEPQATRRSVKLRAGVIGRIAPEKGQLEFVRAVRLLARDREAGEFVVCGEPLFHDEAAER